MAQIANITALAERIRDEFNIIRGIRGELSDLSTIDKSSLVNAINEVLTTANASAVINDTQSNSTTTYSSNKIDSEITTAIANLVDSAPGTLDTLNELATAIQSNDGDIVEVLSSIAANTVRVTNVQSDVDALELAIGDTTRDFVIDFETGLL